MEENGLTFMELIKLIFKKKKLFIINVLLLFVILLSIVFVYNNQNRYYYSDFTYSFSDNKYPDGSSFNYKDIISLDNLNRTKSSDARFEYVDVEKIFENNEIEIIENIYYVEEKANISYTLKIRSSNFNTQQDGKEFIKILINQPISHAKDIIENTEFDTYLKKYDMSNSYVSQIEYLSLQQQYLIDEYQKLIEMTNETYKVNFISLKDYLEQINTYFENNSLENLYTELIVNGYVKDDSFKDSVKYQIDSLELEHKDNLEKIERLTIELENIKQVIGDTVSIDTYSDYNEKISELVVRNVDIERQLTILYRYIGEKYNNGIDATKSDSTLASFVSKLEKHKAKLDEFTAIFSSVYKQIKIKNNAITYSYTSLIKENGGIRYLFAIPICIIGSLFLSALINLIVELPRYYKKEKIEG